ncbi:extensin-like [Salvia miltiorrhiza]|uniref:extensin-like n=1 Tax=Salvia miltiorrhiza TaxID=226208 RepID=UPI0025AD62C8|nr:extensin-like [Salvia miltiorrhiza]
MSQKGVCTPRGRPPPTHGARLPRRPPTHGARLCQFYEGACRRPPTYGAACPCARLHLGGRPPPSPARPARTTPSLKTLIHPQIPPIRHPTLSPPYLFRHHNSPTPGDRRFFSPATGAAPSPVLCAQPLTILPPPPLQPPPPNSSHRLPTPATSTTATTTSLHHRNSSNLHHRNHHLSPPPQPATPYLHHRIQPPPPLHSPPTTTATFSSHRDLHHLPPATTLLQPPNQPPPPSISITANHQRPPLTQGARLIHGRLLHTALAYLRPLFLAFACYHESPHPSSYCCFRR